MNKDLSTYGVAILDHIKNSKRSVDAYGKVSSLEELKIAFGVRKQAEGIIKLKQAIDELIENEYILDLQRGKAFSITPLGSTYRPKAALLGSSPVSYVPNAMEMEILTLFYEQTGDGHDQETIEGLVQDVRRKHKDWTRKQVEEAIRVLIYKRFLDKKDVKTKIPVGMRRVGMKQEYSSVTTHYVILSGKALMLLTNRADSPQATASIHVAETPYSTRRKLEELFASATSSIRIVDSYMGRKTLDYLLSATTPVKIITSSKKKELNFDQALEDFKAEFKPGIEIQESSAFHGRIIIIDESRLYVIDHSIKDFGSKPSSIIEISEAEVKKVYKKLFEDNWSR